MTEVEAAQPSYENEKFDTFDDTKPEKPQELPEELPGEVQHELTKEIPKGLPQDLPRLKTTTKKITGPHKKKASKKTEPLRSEKKIQVDTKPIKPQEQDAWEWKHYHTLYPVANKLLAKKWDDISREKHLKKMADIKKSVDDKSPPRYVHLRVNMKRAQMEQERQESIRRDNKNLISKMSDITKHEHLVEHVKSHLARLEHFKTGQTSSRRLKNQKIQEENLAILERLESSKSDYDHCKDLREAGLRLHHLQNLAAFPQRYIKMIKDGVERDIEKRSIHRKASHDHARHHFHGCYGGREMPNALAMTAYPGEVVAAFTKKNLKEQVSQVDKEILAKGEVTVKPPIPPIVESDGPIARETSPVPKVPEVESAETKEN